MASLCLHRVVPSTTLYYKACTSHFPVLLCTTKLAQNTSQSTLYYKASTKYFSVLLWTTKLAQSTSQYHFVLQSLHKYFPVILGTSKSSRLRLLLGQNIAKRMQHSCSQYNAFCSTTCANMQPLHYDLHPHVAEHSGGTDYASIRSSPAAATLHQKTQGFLLRLPPQHKA